MNQFTGMIEGLIWSPKGSDSNAQHDDWAFEEVILQHDQLFLIGEVIFIADL
jgi:hypothetical protein